VFSLEIAGLDIGLRDDKHAIHYESTPEQKEHLAEWERVYL